MSAHPACLAIAILVGEVVVHCIFNMISLMNDVEHFFMYIWYISFGKYLFKFFPH